MTPFADSCYYFLSYWSPSKTSLLLHFSVFSLWFFVVVSKFKSYIYKSYAFQVNLCMYERWGCSFSLLHVERPVFSHTIFSQTCVSGPLSRIGWLSLYGCFPVFYSIRTTCLLWCGITLIRLLWLFSNLSSSTVMPPASLFCQVALAILGI